MTERHATRRDDDRLCSVSALCDGLLPIAGALIALALLLGLALAH